ncbi:MAG: DUF2730 domain-containing protein [Alphaproteobacteria bacterium HGW-Alphaproteobacteria-8]|nr:MAG: DUF2730 domain-containing protein [Alphaproteobacteria bacterium HGW-Alphaproteobacteria-8]
MMDWDLALKAMGLILPVIAGIYTYVATRRKDVDAALDVAGSRLDRLDARLVRVEDTISGMPGKDDMHSLQLELVKQTGAMNEMRAVMAGNAKIMERLEIIVSRHETHLLEGGKK